jgi:polysaccharide pyruvyl transferase WcaK-like protein
MKFIVTGASTYGVDNMGDDAMFSSLIKNLKSRFQNCDICFLARHPDEKFDHTFNIRSIKNLDHDSNEEAAGRVFLGFNKHDNRSNLLKISSELQSSDGLIIGGNSLMEISENTFLRGVSTYATTLASLALFLGIPYYIFGMNIVSPIQSSFVKQQAKFLIENATSVTVREDVVLDYLKEANIEIENVKVTGDPAYGVDLSFVENINPLKILEKENIYLNDSKKIISVCIRSQYWKSSESSFANLVNEIDLTVREIKKDFPDSQVLFIPNCNYVHGHVNEDDRHINKVVSQKMKDLKEVFFVNQKLNLFETLSLFSIIDIHISNRRHSNIFAALFQKPFIAINTSHKTHISAFVEDLSMEKFLIMEESFHSHIVEKLNYFFQNEKDIKKLISKKIDIFISQSSNSVNLLFDRI